MEFLVKANLTHEEAKKFKGTCATPQSFSYLNFKEGDVVHGDEYYVKKAVDQGAEAGRVTNEEPKEGTVDFYKAELKKREIEFDESAKKADLKNLYDESSK